MFLECKCFEEGSLYLSCIDTTETFDLLHLAYLISVGFNFPFNLILLNKIKYNKDEEISA